MPSSSKSPTDPNLLAGKVVVENIPRRPISHSDVQKWMGKYGNILEISIYKERILVQFTSDLEAAGVVQCENGASFFGTHVAVKHAEMSTLNTLRRSGPPVDRFRRGLSSTNDRDIERDASRERERDRNRDRDRLRDRDREHPRERVPSSMQDRRERDRDDDRRRYRDSQSPRRRSRSPNLARSDRRHVHPLNWLSEVAGNEKMGSHESNRSSQPPPPYTVAIVAVQHDLVPYAETIEKRISLSLRTPDALLGAAPPVRTHIVVLLSLDHLTPCLNDLTRDRVPFAIICTTTNWTHGSCTLRILYVPTQQEHRNMPLDDAMSLLQREYELYLTSVLPVSSHLVPFTTTTNNAGSVNSAGSLPVQQPLPVNVHRPETITDAGADGDDEVVDTFVPPSRHVSALLRMLADARVLSIGELDEITAFVAERKRRLEGRKRLGSEADTKDLKLRILNMLYPQSSGGGPANSSEPVAVSSSNAQPLPQLHQHQQQQQHLPGPSYSGFLTGPLLSSGKSGMPPLMPPPPVLSQQPPASGSTGKPAGGTNSLATANKLAENLSNPAVRHALDTLMNLPTSSLTQMSTGTASIGMAQPGLQQQQQLRGVAPPTTTLPRSAGAYAGVKHGGVGRGTVYENGLPTDASRYPGSGRGGHFAPMSQQRGASGAPTQTHQSDGYPTRESDSGSAAGSGNNKYYGFKQPQQPSRNPGSAGGGGGGGAQTGGGSLVDGYRQREMSGGGGPDYYHEDDFQTSAVGEPAGRGSGWPVKRKRGKRGAILGSRPVASGYPGQRLPSYAGPPGHKGSQPRADALVAVVASAAAGISGGGAGLTDLMSAEVTPVGSVAEAYRADAIGGFMPSYSNPPYFHSGAPGSYPVPGERFY